MSGEIARFSSDRLPQASSVADLRRQLAAMGDANLAQLDESLQFKKDTERMEQQTAEAKKAESDRIKAALATFTLELPLATQTTLSRYVGGGFDGYNEHHFEYKFLSPGIQQARDLDEKILWVPIGHYANVTWPNPARGGRHYEGVGKSLTPAYVVGKRMGETNTGKTDAQLDLLLAPAFHNKEPRSNVIGQPPLALARVSMRAYDELTTISLEERSRMMDQTEYEARAESEEFYSDRLTGARHLNTYHLPKLVRLPAVDPTREKLPWKVKRLRKALANRGLGAELLWTDPVELNQQDLQGVGGFDILGNTAELADVFGAGTAFDRMAGTVNGTTSEAPVSARTSTGHSRLSRILDKLS